jgi:glycosyltransferase involved in cell wall biosynthesis
MPSPGSAASAAVSAEKRGATSAGDSEWPTLSVIVPATDRPPTLLGCLRALEVADEPPEEIMVVDRPAGAGPALARNIGALRATGSVLVFVDADVEVRRDALARIRAAFRGDPELDAVFGSYNDDPTARSVVSSFRNLLHHHVHRTSAGPATTFWSGLGALRRAAFESCGGFDADRFPHASVEDVDLGMRLAAKGARVILDPRVEAVHRKAWTLRTMVHTDLFRRGMPWVALQVRSRYCSTALNLGWRHRLSAGLCIGGLAAAVLGRPRGAAGAVGALIALNRSFYSLLLRRRGPLEAFAGVGLHVLHHLTATVSIPAGVAMHALEAARRRGAFARPRRRLREMEPSR